MRVFASVAVILAAVAGILGLSVAGALREQERLLDQFTVTTRQQGHASVEGLAARQAVAAHQRSLLRRIVGTALAAALAVAGVGLVILRQQRKSVALAGRLQYRSELRSLENQLVRAEKVITVGVLSAGIAHEIGSPLAVIRGRAEQVLRHVEAGPRADDLRVIIKHIDQISSTIRQLLDFSRRQPIERRAVALETAVERARALLQWKLEARQLRLEVALDDELPLLAADPDQLAQMLVNLLLNACDASTPGTEVRLTAQAARGGGVRLEVIDHGCGIAPEHMNAVFDPFFTTKKRGEGTGLGLSIVASIVRNHAGEINLASTPGSGTTVTVTWPELSAAEAARA